MQDQDNRELATECSQVDPYILHLQKCLSNIHKVIQKTNDILCSISHPSVCSEVLLSSRGTDYISEVLEVYRISKRIEGGMKTLHLDYDSLQLALRDIELSWNNLQAFLSLCPCVLQMLPPPSSLDYKVKGTSSDPVCCLKRCCGVCLLEEEPLGGESVDNMLMHGGHLYHPSCANFWLNCIDSNLPVLSCHKNCCLYAPS
ncbi:synergin gamma-like [Spea bombifrons]|uniref:synergin gamma-like n=1 Tax=Spea bombifrons TaxID=233779 RepID=UPI00234C01A7|nr:synergin gamma-like [Spea bombifrons]